jgi:hypothetical protein
MKNARKKAFRYRGDLAKPLPADIANLDAEIGRRLDLLLDQHGIPTDEPAAISLLLLAMLQTHVPGFRIRPSAAGAPGRKKDSWPDALLFNALFVLEFSRLNGRRIKNAELAARLARQEIGAEIGSAEPSAARSRRLIKERRILALKDQWENHLSSARAMIRAWAAAYAEHVHSGGQMTAMEFVQGLGAASHDTPKPN